MFKLSLVILILTAWCAGSYAQTSGGDHDTIQTVAGALSVTKVQRVQKDGATFNATLNGANFDQLYGSHYVYYTDSDGTAKPATRIVLEDFVGGFSDLPSLTLYDFRKSPPVALPISDKLDLENVRWTDSSVLLSADGKLYLFSRNRLSRLKAPEKAIQ